MRDFIRIFSSWFTLLLLLIFIGHASLSLTKTIDTDDAIRAELSNQEFEQDFQRFFKGKDYNFQLMGPDDESTPETVDQQYSQPRPIVRVQSKVMDFYVGRRQKHVVAIYVMITTFLTRFKTKHMESLMPDEPIQLMTMAGNHQDILIQNQHGLWEKYRLHSQKWYDFKTNSYAKFPFAIVAPEDLTNVAYIRIRTQSMPQGYSYVYAASLNFLRGISHLSADKLRKVRGGVRITRSHVKQEDLQAAVSATNQLVPLMLFSGAKSVFKAQTNQDETGLDIPLKVSAWNDYQQRYHKESGRKRNRDEETEDNSPESKRLRKRSWDPTLMLQHHDHLESPLAAASDHEDSLTPTALHWEFTENDSGVFVFKRHTNTSIIERVGELANTTLDQVLSEHHLFKRGIDRQSVVQENDFSENPKSIMITSDDNRLIVKFFSWTGRLVRKVVETIRQAYQLIRHILNRIGVLTQKLVQWLRAVFNWDSILRALKVSTLNMAKMPVHAMQILAKKGGVIRNKVQHWKNELIGTLDNFILKLKGQGSFVEMRSRLQNELADAQQEDHQATFLQDYINQNINSTDGKIQCEGLPNANQLDEVQALKKLADAVYDKILSKLGTTIEKKEFLMKTDLKAFGNGLFAAAAAEFLTVVRNTLESVFDLTQEVAEMVFTELAILLNDIAKLVHCRIHIPGVSELWENVITRGSQRFTIASLSALPGATAFVIMYKSLNQAHEPFDNDDVRALSLSAKPTDFLARWAECSDCRSLDVLPLENRLNILTWLFGYTKIFMAGMLALTEPAQATVKYLVPFKPVFHFMHHMTAFPYQMHSKGKAINPVSLYSWMYGLVPLVFLSSSNPARSTLETVVRFPHVALSVMEFERDLKEEKKSLEAELNPSSAIMWKWRLKSLSDVLNSIPQLPGVMRLAQYKANPRAVSAALDLIRMQLSMWMNWKF